jgi:ribokinase
VGCDHVVVVGSANMDLMLRCLHLPAAGETVLGDDFATAPGGKGANQAVAAARMGARVAFVGCVGDDSFGDVARRALEAEGIDTRHLARLRRVATGVAIVLTDLGGENCIALASGANAALAPEHIDAAASVLDGAALLICQLESPLPTVRYAIDAAARRSVPVLLNPAPACALPDGMLAKVDYLVANAVEASVLSGREARDAESAIGAAEALRAGGARNVLVTLGSAGVVVATGRGSSHVPAKPVRAVDTTGAGDAFVGALASGLVERVPLDAAIDLAQRAAAFSVGRRGAQASMARRADLGTTIVQDAPR